MQIKVKIVVASSAGQGLVQGNTFPSRAEDVEAGAPSAAG